MHVISRIFRCILITLSYVCYYHSLHAISFFAFFFPFCVPSPFPILLFTCLCGVSFSPCCSSVYVPSPSFHLVTHLSMCNFLFHLVVHFSMCHLLFSPSTSPVCMPSPFFTLLFTCLCVVFFFHLVVHLSPTMEMKGMHSGRCSFISVICYLFLLKPLDSLSQTLNKTELKSETVQLCFFFNSCFLFVDGTI